MNIILNSAICNKVFEQALNDYRQGDKIKTALFGGNELKDLLYKKQWIDNLQWDAEDHVRDKTKPTRLRISLKEQIDKLNQERTDVIEAIDAIIYKFYEKIPLQPDHRINTESPAWAIDRLSILTIKIFQMHRASKEAKGDLKLATKNKLQILENQKIDLSMAIDMLLDDLRNGLCKVSTYQQMKMYNDANLNPVLRKTHV